MKGLNMITTSIIWIIVSLMFLILEFGHPGLLFFLSFCFGALSAATTAFYDQLFFIQIISFFGGACVSFCILRLFLKKMHRSVHATNIYALVGKQGIVTEEIKDDQFGYVKVQHQLWPARTKTLTSLPKNTPITVLHVQGAHVVVEKNTH